MGYFADGQCFATQVAAASQACAKYPMTYTSGSNVYTLSCVGVDVGGSQLQLSRTQEGVVGAVSTFQELSFPACDESQQYTDSNALFGLFLAAGALLWAVKTFVLKLVTPQ